ncbi:MAG: hypothetical protein ACI9XB_005414, partial [Gammaproteobacteria bacterium]
MKNVFLYLSNQHVKRSQLKQKCNALKRSKYSYP